jgi:hypothetical protein
MVDFSPNLGVDGAAPTTSSGSARFGDSEISRHALASGFPRRRGLAPPATHFGNENGERHGTSRRFKWGKPTLPIPEASAFPLKVSGIGLAPGG